MALSGGLDATYVDSSTFTLAGQQDANGVNYTDIFTEGRSIRADCGSDDIVYSFVASSSYDSGDDETTVNIADDVLTDNLDKIWFGVSGVEALPEHGNDQHTSDYVPEAPEDGEQYARKDGGWVKIPKVLQPSVTSPSDGETATYENPDIVLSTYYSLYGKAQKAIRVQVSDTSGDFSDPVFDKTIEDETDTVKVESGNLEENKTYYCHGQYQDIDDVWSEWSDEISFTTADTFEPDIAPNNIDHGPGPFMQEEKWDSANDVGYYGYVGCGNEPTYDSGTTYDKGDIVNDGDDEFYYSKVNSNSGNSLPGVRGENDNWKWIGNGVLTDGPTVSSEIGLSAGTAFNDDCGWLKFFIGKNAADPMSTRHGTVTAKDRVVFISRKTIRNGLDWDAIYDAGAVYGTGDSGTANSGSDTTQDAQITIDGNDYIVRLMTGCQGDPASEEYVEQSCSDDEGGGSEWNDLLYRVHEDEPTCSDPNIGMPGGHEDDRHGGPQDGDNWESFTNVDLQVYDSEAGDGTYCWCQEQGDNTSRRVCRGDLGVAAFFPLPSDSYQSYGGFRPVLELIQP